MKKLVALAFILTGLSVSSLAQLKPGDSAVGFKLENVDGNFVSLSDYAKEKGVILVFTCNPCPFSKAYEDRIIKLHTSLAQYGYPVVAINPNNEKVSPDDTMDEMKKRAKEKNFPFVYLKDSGDIYKKYGATRTPHFFLLHNENGKGNFKVVYIGAMDNNAMDEKAVSEKYVVNAAGALEKGLIPDPAEIKAIGCTIK